MAASDDELPLADYLHAALGLEDLRELCGGHQSKVYLGRAGGELVVAKLVDASRLDHEALDVRLSMLSRLSSVTNVVCAPLPLEGKLRHDLRVNDSTVYYVVCYQYAEGDEPDVTRPADASAMGQSLAELHQHLATLPLVSLPPITGFQDRAGLRAVASGLGLPATRLPDPGLAEHFGQPQLLHGDFSSANIRISAGQARVFDFDDSGYGPVEFDLANSLYVVLFDAYVRRDPGRYSDFRASFLGGYRARRGAIVSELSLDDLITQRVVALASWLANPSSAPPGIRTSSSAWMETLKSFIDSFFEP